MKSKTYISGFTLIETLVAISILMIAVVVPLSIVAGALQSSFYSRDQITAVYLAQDAMEYVKNVRDSNALKNIEASINGGGQISWLEGLKDCLLPPPSKACKIDTTRGASGEVSSEDKEHPADLFVSDSGVYGYSSGTDSRFSRVIQIEPIGGDASDEAQVTITVSWTGSSAYPGRTFTVSENIYNVWKQAGEEQTP